MSDIAETRKPVQKRLNRVTLFLFAMAALLVVLDLSSGLLIAPILRSSAMKSLGSPPSYLWNAIVRTVRETIYSVSLLVALGALIEMVDQVLWRLTPEAERSVK
jgi:hypothetical protein